MAGTKRFYACFLISKALIPPFLVRAFNSWTRQPKIQGHLFNTTEGIQKSKQCNNEMADLADSSSSARDLFYFRFHIFLVPSHLPSLLGESHKDSGMGKQNKKDSCKNTKSAQSQHLELSVMLQGDYCSYPNWEKTEDRTGRGSYPVLMSRGSSSLTVPHCFAP